MALKLLVSFHYYGPELGKILEEMAEAAYMKAYSEFADYANERYDVWNKEYDELGGPKDGLDEEGYINPNSQYNAFIYEKYNPILEKLNYLPDFPMKRYFIGSEGQLCGELINGTKMDFTLSKEK